MWHDVSFGSDKTGLATVGYVQYKSDGSDAVARTTTGVVETGGGGYGCLVTEHIDAVGIKWDTGEATPRFAHEDLSQADIHRSIYNRRQWDKTANTVTIYEGDKITPRVVLNVDDALTDIGF